MNHFLMAGILLNTLLIVINRFVKPLPNRLEFPLLLLGIGLIIVGFLQTK